MTNMLTFHPVGDSGLKVQLGTDINIETNRKILALKHLLQHENIQGIDEIVPSYISLTIYFHPLRLKAEKLKRIVEHLVFSSEDNPYPLQTEIETVYIPVCYGGEVGPDLERVAHHNDISVEDVIKLHTAEEYLVYMMRFLPGFPYLGGLSTKLHTPRLSQPRRKVERGSVGIADQQTGVYPISSPGGWNIIGQTPIQLFKPNDNEPFLLKAGQFIKFFQIDIEEFQRIEKEENESGGYTLKIVRRSCDDTTN